MAGKTGSQDCDFLVVRMEFIVLLQISDVTEKVSVVNIAIHTHMQVRNCVATDWHCRDS